MGPGGAFPWPREELFTPIYPFRPSPLSSKGKRREYRKRKNGEKGEKEQNSAHFKGILLVQGNGVGLMDGEHIDCQLEISYW